MSPDTLEEVKFTALLTQTFCDMNEMSGAIPEVTVNGCDLEVQLPIPSCTRRETLKVPLVVVKTTGWETLETVVDEKQLDGNEME